MDTCNIRFPLLSFFLPPFLSFSPSFFPSFLLSLYWYFGGTTGCVTSQYSTISNRSTHPCLIRPVTVSQRENQLLPRLRCTNSALSRRNTHITKQALCYEANKNRLAGASDDCIVASSRVQQWMVPFPVHAAAECTHSAPSRMANENRKGEGGSGAGRSGFWHFSSPFLLPSFYHLLPAFACHLPSATLFSCCDLAVCFFVPPTN